MERLLAILADYKITDVGDPRSATGELKALLALAFEIENTERVLVRRLNGLISRCNTAIETVERPHAINPLGVVQGAGNEVDVAASKLGTLREQLAIRCGQYRAANKL